MTDEELIKRLRLLNEVDANVAADRIEALVKDLGKAEDRERVADHMAAKYLARAERLEAALREIESIDVHSGGEIHGVTALQWELAFGHAQDVASAALKGDDHV